MGTRRGDLKDKEGAGQCQNREGDTEVRGSQGYEKPDLTSELMGGLIKAVCWIQRENLISFLGGVLR